jgi:hypothetical protein
VIAGCSSVNGESFAPATWEVCSTQPRLTLGVSGVLPCPETTARRPYWLAGGRTRTAESAGIEVRPCCRGISPISPTWRSRDGSRSSCGVTNVQLRQGFCLVLRARRRMTAGLFNMPGWQDSNFGSRKENNPSPGVILRSTPCGEPSVAWCRRPSSRTPAFSHLSIIRRITPSVTRWSRKPERKSAESNQNIFGCRYPTPTAVFVSCRQHLNSAVRDEPSDRAGIRMSREGSPAHTPTPGGERPQQRASFSDWPTYFCV